MSRGQKILASEHTGEPVTPTNRSYGIAAVAGLSGVGALVAASLFVFNSPEPPPGSDGFAHGLAGIGLLLYSLLGLLVVGVGVTLVVLEVLDGVGPRERLVAQAGVVLATVGPPLVLVWAHLDGPIELTGAAAVAVLAGSLLVMGLCTWVFVAEVVRGIRASVG